MIASCKLYIAKKSGSQEFPVSVLELNNKYPTKIVGGQNRVRQTSRKQFSPKIVAVTI